MNKLSNKLNSISNFLMRPVDASTLGTFRILFGIIMFWSTLRYFYKGWIEKKFIGKTFHFTYELFPFVAPWSGDGMYYHFIVMGLAALFLALGLFYRFSAVVFFLSYTYVFLIDKTEYNNHYYFICLLGFLFCFVNADRWMSLDNLWEKKSWPGTETGTVPWWQLFLLKTQVFIVYFYGGIAKINWDWLRGEPFRHWLIEPAERESTPEIVAKFLKSEFGVYFFSYGGLIFDLAIGFLLIYRKTRLLAIGLILIFNLTNNWLFHIGVFPFLMIGATVLFLEPDTPRKWVLLLFPRFRKQTIDLEEKPSRFRKFALAFVSIYLALQIALPFRHWLYDGHVSWTEEGHNFSWRMKLRSKEFCRIWFLATDTETGETWSIPPKELLTFRQFEVMCSQPSMIIQFAHYLGGEFKKHEYKTPVIKIKSEVSLNYRPPRAMIDPDVNMLEVDYHIFSHADWILPLKE